MASSDAVVVQVGGAGAKAPGALETEVPAEDNPGMCHNPMATIPSAVIGVFSVVVLILGFVSLAAGDGPLYVAGAVALLGSTGIAGYLCATGGLRHQLARFKHQNDRLAKTSAALRGDVDNLEVTNQKIALHVDKLEDSVDELQGVSEKLKEDIEGFGDLRVEMEALAKEAGKDLDDTLESINGMYDRMQDLNAREEKALLKRVAQDLEFMDRDEKMSKEEFQRFLQRIPAQFKKRFEELDLTFASIAGADKGIDYKEMGRLIDRLIAENDEQVASRANKPGSPAAAAPSS
ncbi:unnamed protein product [Ostreobium quekettii]|uniref:Uncharacterized protein n=1 Tax=Ostreobium quekettii TaxID=121088 RepID=A0A8S1JGG9_9CHLO|nr:unnamed protein product [Ostreobium quekettii]|eukprot:evm.model.scf_489.5 EVM.evm.TU.scf_489.5   scf_489:48767-50108(+)